jgi:hypothetical protein
MKNIPQSNYGRHDSRDGLGYGLLNPSGRHSERPSNNSFPYYDSPSLSKEDHEELDQEFDNLDPDIEAAINSKSLSVAFSNDTIGNRGNPFYFHSGLKISEALNALSNSMVPFPKMYSNIELGPNPSYNSSLGPADGFSSTKDIKTGSKKGFSKPHLTQDQIDEPINVMSIKDILTVSTDEFKDEEHVKRVNAKTKKIQIKESFDFSNIWYHTTNKENIEKIKTEGLKINSVPKGKSIGSLDWVFDAYNGVKPIFLSKNPGLYKGDVVLKINTTGLSLVADIPGLVDFGAYIAEDGVFWDESELNNSILQIVDNENFDISFNKLNKQTRQSKEAINLTGTCAVKTNIEPWRIEILNK